MSRSVTLFILFDFILIYVFFFFLPLRLRSVTLRIRYHMRFLLSSILNSKFDSI